MVYVVPVGTGSVGAVYNLYYTPAYASGWGSYSSVSKSDEFIRANTFCTINITDPYSVLTEDLSDQTGTSHIFTGDTVTLKNGTDISWNCTDTNGNEISGTVNETAQTTTFTLTYDGSTAVSPFTISAQSENRVLTLSVDGTQVSWRVAKGTNLQEWLKNHAEETIILNGEAVSISHFIWQLEGAEIGESDVLEENTVLTGIRQSWTITLKNTDGEIQTYSVQEGTHLLEWLQQMSGESFGTSVTHPTVESYSWIIEGSDSQIGSSAAVYSDMTLIGTPRTLVTVTFAAVKPNTEDEELLGGAFANSDADYISIQLYQGDYVPAEFFAKMCQNLQIKSTHAFDGWYYSADQAGTGSGELEMLETTEVVSDLTVYAKYKTNATYTFYTDRSMTTVHSTATNLPVGESYKYEIPTITAPEGKTFRYWVNATDNKVFTKQDTVIGDADLYPVFERYIFEFVQNGKILTSLYDGNKLQYSAAELEDYYFAGFAVEKADGSGTVLIPNGTVITPSTLADLGIEVPSVVDGVYELQAELVYLHQHNIVYHGGTDGQLVLTDEAGGNTYTEKADDSVILLGAMDITNVTSPIGLALAGWAVSEEDAAAGTITYQPYQTLSQSELDAAANEENGYQVDLYPVWAQQEDTIKVTFKSNYPDGATYNGETLEEDTYTIYIRTGTKPTLPELARVDMAAPDNVLESSGELRYELVGWSVLQSGAGYTGDKGSTDVQKNGVYSLNSEYVLALTQDTVFYAIWADRDDTEDGFAAEFFIRHDGTLPTEPGSHPSDNYTPSSAYHSGLKIQNALRALINVVNDPDKVEANIMKQPDYLDILKYLQIDQYEDDHFDMMKQGLTWDAENSVFTVTDEEQVTYGTDWWIEWYACKPAGSCSTYHVDGRIRFADQVELNYHGNGGSYVPDGKVYEPGEMAEVEYTQSDGTKPQLDNFTFIGWSEDPDALVPTWYDPEYAQIPAGAPTTIYMDTDKDLYAVWEPNATTIPLEGPFSGVKYVEENGETAAADTAGQYTFFMKLIEKPDEAEDWSMTASNLADGSFSFGQISVKYPGTYVFEVWEEVGSDHTIQYDSSVYHLTVNIVLTDYGLGIGGYSFTKSGKPVMVSGTSVEDAVFQFTNRIGIRDISVRKQWDDGEDTDGLRPDEIEVRLLQNGSYINSEDSVQTLSALNDWQYIWENLDSKDDNGVAYLYTVEETSSYSGYETTVSGDMNNGFTITNKHTPLTYNIPVTKIWDDQDDVYGLRPSSVELTLKGYKTTADQENGDTVYERTAVLTASEDTGVWAAVFEDVPVYAEGTLIQYVLEEKVSDFYESSIVREEVWDGSWKYTVTNTIKTTDVTVTKNVTGNMGDKQREFAFTAELLDSSENVIDSYEFSLKHGESTTLKGLPEDLLLWIKEADCEEYEVSWETTVDEDGEESDQLSAESGDSVQMEIVSGLKVTCTNQREEKVGTGVRTDHTPYLALTGIVMIGLFAAGIGKRRRMRSE